MGHRRFLPHNHPYRQKKSWFDGTQEDQDRPRPMTSNVAFQAVKNLKNDFGKKDRKLKRKKPSMNSTPWKKKSIFFDLPYWDVSDL